MRWVIVFVAALAMVPVGQACPPSGWDRPQLEQLKRDKFAIKDQVAREAFAESVVSCVASADPYLRDAIAFEGLSHMLREEQLGTPVRLRVARDLLRRLASRDALGFEAPFAALILSEVVRTDRVKAYMPAELRSEIAEGAIAFLAGVRDYRGFDEREGWRHGVAHGADLAMQIALNPNFERRDQLVRLRDAVASQISPAGHFYIYGEPDRLMRPIAFLAQRKVFDAADWRAWFEKVAAPAPLAAWDDAYRSQMGLAKVHNTRAFLYAVWLNARISQSTDDDVLLVPAEAALRALP